MYPKAFVPSKGVHNVLTKQSSYVWFQFDMLFVLFILLANNPSTLSETWTAKCNSVQFTFDRTNQKALLFFNTTLGSMQIAQGTIDYDDGNILRAPMDGNAPSFNGLTEIELNASQNKVNIRYLDTSTGTISDGLFCSAKISGAPTNSPSKRPSKRPSTKPTPKRPTRKPSKQKPTNKPTMRKSKRPSRKPSIRPTKKPTKNPSRRPSKKPTARPSKKPSYRQTNRPTKNPASNGSSCPIFPSDHVWNTPINC